MGRTQELKQGAKHRSKYSSRGTTTAKQGAKHRNHHTSHSTQESGQWEAHIYKDNGGRAIINYKGTKNYRGQVRAINKYRTETLGIHVKQDITPKPDTGREVETKI